MFRSSWTTCTSYFERRRFQRFKTVLDEMRQLDVVGSLRQLGDELNKENGLSIAQCEFWSDTLDRWAEDLVDPAGSGKCNAKSKSSLPPALVLEALQILEGEMNLREDTRVAEQARPALEAPKYKLQADQLSGTQKGLTERVDKLGDGDSRASRRRERIRLRDRPPGQGLERHAGGRRRFWRSRKPAARPSARRPRPSSCLLQSKRINPKGAAVAARRPAAADTARRSTRRWHSSAAASTRKRSGKTAASRSRPVKPGRPCPKSSVPASTSISTGSNGTRAGDRSRASSSA